ncbi:MAG: DUF4349 domain-containing protein [Oscillospiraceae bacterium]|nr:DUF4349 domain-containing protein [Oscillospiraceae bacterium]
MKKLTALLLTVLMVLTLFTACGGSSKSQVAMDYAMEEKMEAEAPAAMMNSASDTLTGAGETGSTALPENRKWIITVHMDAETEDLDALLAGLDQKITAMGGYVEDQDIYNGSSYASRRHRNANLTIRIPAADVDAFTEEVKGIANVVSTNLNRDDITLNYVATESKITALKTEEARLLELLAQAETMSDLLEIEARLSDVRYELERYSSQLRLYDNQVDYATIYLFISEVQEYTPVAEKTVWERIRDGFSSSVKGLKDGIVDTVVWILVNSPYLLVWGIILTILAFAARKLRRGRKAKKVVPPPQNEAK